VLNVLTGKQYKISVYIAGGYYKGEATAQMQDVARTVTVALDEVTED
jgi:hypothetical protein